jgi:hypothetical protein
MSLIVRKKYLCIQSNVRYTLRQFEDQETFVTENKVKVSLDIGLETFWEKLLFELMDNLC